MTFQIVSFVRYLTAPGVQWTQPYYDANKVVKALKQEEIRGFANLNIAGNALRLDRTTTRGALLNFLARVIVTSLGTQLAGNHYLVPVPNSSCTVSNGSPSNVCELATAIAAVNPSSRVWDGLRWQQERLKSSMGGTRSRHILLENYACLEAVPRDLPGIVLDDVATTGNHLLAARDFWCSRGGESPWGLIVGRTVHDTSQRALGALIENLQD